MPGAFMLPTTLRPVLPGILFLQMETYPPAAIPMTGLIHVWRACEVELEPELYRHTDSKDWDASLVSNLRSDTLSQIVLATILQIG